MPAVRRICLPASSAAVLYVRTVQEVGHPRNGKEGEGSALVRVG